MKHIKPVFSKDNFNCPFCNVHTHQVWGDTLEHSSTYGSGWHKIPELKSTMCTRCEKVSIWKGNQLIYPDSMNMAPPNEDLEESIKLDYNEAASIVEKSPRSAAALLRLAIERLCKNQLREKGTLDECIGSLVIKGLPVEIKEALDIVRVIGNEAVHPGEIDLNDNKEIAYKLFELVNIIAQDRITQPKEISTLHSSLPKKKLEGISKRDSKK